MKSLLLFLFSSSVLALTPHTANYTLSSSLMYINLAKDQRTLSVKDGVYSYTENAKTTGIISLIKDYEIYAKSVFVINKFGMQTKHYQNFERDGNTVKKDINIYPTTRQLDSLNRLLAITNLLEKNPNKKDFYLLVNDGKVLEQQHYEQVQSDDDNLIKVISKEKNIEAYFAKNKHYLPVLIHRDEFTYRLDSIKW